MNVRRTNLFLRTLAATLAGGAVVGVALGVLLPADVAQREPADSGRTTVAASRRSPDEQESIGAFEPLWALSLRKPLTDAPVASAATQGDAGGMAAGQAGPFILLGTIGDSLVMIRTTGGTVEVKGVGEQAGGARILAVRPSQVDVEIAGERRTLVKPREGGGG